MRTRFWNLRTHANLGWYGGLPVLSELGRWDSQSKLAREMFKFRSPEFSQTLFLVVKEDTDVRL